MNQYEGTRYLLFIQQILSLFYLKELQLKSIYLF